MTDERDDDVVRSDVRRPPRLDRDPRRPPGPWREQEARHHPDWLAIRAGRIKEPVAIKMIGAVCHAARTTDLPGSLQAASGSALMGIKPKTQQQKVERREGRPCGLAAGRRLVQGHGGPNESLQSLFVQLVAFVEVDGAPGVAFETGIEEA